MTKEEMNKICLECGGLCCKVQTTECSKDDQKAIDFYETKRYINKFEVKDKLIYLMEFPCIHQAIDGKCTIYDQKRPQICYDFPTKSLAPKWILFCELARQLYKEREQSGSVLLVL